ncbi:hypothetical protein PR048_029811 [Dryococelus australis]|uniref:Uncharacterized protein n=1 Tax=Dryococelus australis TaxID=614101 RepID=A0ABQ9G765_9NEOP|nr:hypothetical protein PR048_029811 [Dryococelus australis]
MKRRGKRDIPEKTSRPTASFGTIPTCENTVTRPGIERGSSWWEAVVAKSPLSILATLHAVRSGGEHNLSFSASRRCPSDRLTGVISPEFRRVESKQEARQRKMKIHFQACLKLVRLLASHQGDPGSIPDRASTRFSHVGIVPDDAAGRRVFSEISHLPYSCILVKAVHDKSKHLSQHRRQLDELAVTKVPIGLHRYLEPCCLQCVPQLLKGAWRRRQTVNMTIEVVPQIFNRIQIGAVWGLGKNFEVLIVLLQPCADTSSCGKAHYRAEDPILLRKDNHHVRTFLAGHTDGHPFYAAETVIRLTRRPVAHQQQPSCHAAEQIPVFFVNAPVLAWVCSTVAVDTCLDATWFIWMSSFTGSLPCIAELLVAREPRSTMADVPSPESVFWHLFPQTLFIESSSELLPSTGGCERGGR